MVRSNMIPKLSPILIRGQVVVWNLSFSIAIYGLIKWSGGIMFPVLLLF